MAVEDGATETSCLEVGEELEANHLVLDDEVEGNRIFSGDYRFFQIGKPVPVVGGRDSTLFDYDSLPLQPLAVSETFGLLFLVHPDGFYVARTVDVIASAEEIEEKRTGPSVLELSIVDVPIKNVSILALSADDSCLAATVGSVIHFFSVSALVDKEHRPSFSLSLDDSSNIKDLRWTKRWQKYYVVLSSSGKLYYGTGQSPHRYLDNDIDAVEWSPEGNFLAVAKKQVVSILSSKFKERLSMSLSIKSLTDDCNATCTMKVDSIRWVRPDCIILGCYQLADSGEAENYVIQVVTSKKGKITDASSKPVVLSFDEFPNFDGNISSAGNGPLMFFSYLDKCALALIGNRNITSDCLVLLAWSVDGVNHEATFIDAVNDTLFPKIELQENDDDNFCLGFCLDKVSQKKDVKFPVGISEKEVSPSCVFLCLTVEGKLILYHFVSATSFSDQPVSQSGFINKREDDSLVLSESSQIKVHLGVKDGSMIEDASTLEAEKINVSEQREVGEQLPLKKDQLQLAYHKSRTDNHVADQNSVKGGIVMGNQEVRLQSFNRGDQHTESGQQSMWKGNKVELSPLKMPNFDISRPSARDFKRIETSTLDDATNGAGSFRGKLSLDLPSEPSQKYAQNENKLESTAPSFSGKPKFLPIKGNNRSPSSARLIISEPGMHKQFHNVEEMVKELDVLLERIEGKGGFKDASIVSPKSSVISLEESMRNLSIRCRDLNGIMDEHQKEIQFLLAKTVEVLARKTYMEEKFKQANDSNYWAFWNRQKLSLELELKQQHILELNQVLANVLIELGRHFNTLELKKFGEKAGVHTHQKVPQNRHGSSRHFESLYSLHSTLNAQLAAAEQLAESLSNQMTALSIDSASEKQKVKKELFKTIGIPYDVVSYKTPARERSEATPADKNVLTSFCYITEQFRRKQSNVTNTSEPESMRRRRESLDRSLTASGPAKVTLKRTLLQEDRQKIRTSLLMDKRLGHISQKGSATAQPMHHAAVSALPSENEGIQDIFTKPHSRSSGPLFQLHSGNLSQDVESSFQFGTSISQSNARNTTECTAESSRSIGSSEKASLAVVSLSESIQQSKSHLHQTPVSVESVSRASVSPKSFGEVFNMKDKAGALACSTFENSQAIVANSSGHESGNDLLSTFESVSNFSGNVLLSDMNLKSQSCGMTSASSSVSISWPSTVISSSSAFPSSPNQSGTMSLPVVSLGRSTSTEAYFNVDQTASLSHSSASSPNLSSSYSFQAVEKSLSLSFGTPVINVSPTPPNTRTDSVVVKASQTTNENLFIQPLTTKFTHKTEDSSTKQIACSQTEPPHISSPEVRPLMPAKQTSESVPPKSSQTDNLFTFDGAVNPASNVLHFKQDLPDAPDVQLSHPIPSSASLTAGKNEDLDVSNNQEDDMEEEASDNGRTAELSLESLVGFGIGSTSQSSSVKQNPFGLASTTTASNSSSCPFTMTIPSGEMFRPASFNFQSLSTSQPPNAGGLSSGFSMGIVNPIASGSAFGQPAQIGAGQQALGSVLGSFGQSRQIGGLPAGGVAPAIGFNGGFAKAASGAGFANLASANGGFAAAAPGGGGFAAAGPSGGGFAAAGPSGGGFAAAASGGGGFAAAASGGQGFAAAASGGGGFGGQISGGFGSFNQAGSGDFAFNTSTGAARPPSELFTQMRK